MVWLEAKASINHLEVLLAKELLTVHRALPTFLVLHLHPFLLSYGHWSAKVAWRASTSSGRIGFSWPSASRMSPSLLRELAIITAKPQLGASLICSRTGSSSCSHPSSM